MTHSRKKENSAKAIGAQRADAVNRWLTSNPEIPIYQGRANQAEIGRRFGITKSTWGSNPRLKVLWQQIQIIAAKQIHHTVQPRKSNHEQPEDIRNLLKEKDRLINWLRRELSRAESRVELLELDGAAEEFLIQTGRYIPYSTLNNESEFDPEPTPSNEL